MNFWFLCGTCLILVHEMDAVRCREWRMHPFFSWIKDETLAYWAFVWVHVPLYIGLALAAASTSIGTGAIFWWNVFLVVHVALHIMFLWHPRNEFHSVGSWLLIAGSGACGLIAILTG
jgi:hypothetical protein